MRKLLIAGLIALSLVGISSASASIPAPDGTINGCYVSNPPRVLIIRDSTETCPSGTTALNWNQTGPPGPQGPAGFANAATTSSLAPASIPTTVWTTVDSVSVTLTATHNVLISVKLEGPAAQAQRLLIDGSPVQTDGVVCPDNVHPALACDGNITWSASMTAGAHTIASQVFFTSGGQPVTRTVDVHSLTAIDLGS